MKHVISLAVLLAISTVALANNNSPAQRCKRYAEANAFQSTIAQLCGGNTESEYAGVLRAQACEETVGKEKLADQSKTKAMNYRPNTTALVTNNSVPNIRVANKA